MCIYYCNRLYAKYYNYYSALYAEAHSFENLESNQYDISRETYKVSDSDVLKNNYENDSFHTMNGSYMSSSISKMQLDVMQEFNKYENCDPENFK